MTDERPVDTRINLEKEPELNKFFKAVIKSGASDLHIKVGQVPKIRLHGQLKNTTGDAITEERIEELVFELMSSAQKDYFLKHGYLEMAHEVTDSDRFRISVYRQRGFISLTARWVNTTIPPFDTLNMPDRVKQFATAPEGLIIVSGPSGSGKTTTIASLVDYINSTRNCHIMTFEDPIEYLYKDKKAIVSQREIGTDVLDFEEALRAINRQDPDVVVIGELTDQKTIIAAMGAAVTGHLVFGTINAANTLQVVQKILDAFPVEDKNFARQTLSQCLRAVICQQLVPCVKDGIDMVPLVEILLSNAIVRRLLADGREAGLPNVIRACTSEGMKDTIDALSDLINKQLVDLRVAYDYAPNEEELKMAMRGIRTPPSGIL